MKKNVLLTAAVLALSVSASVYAQMQPVPTGGRRPEIHRAIHALETARNDLQQGAVDPGGHRAKAQEHVNAALQELQLALQAQ